MVQNAAQVAMSASNAAGAHLLTTALADTDLVVTRVAQHSQAVSSVDLWAAQVYRGPNFGQGPSVGEGLSFFSVWPFVVWSIQNIRVCNGGLRPPNHGLLHVEKRQSTTSWFGVWIRGWQDFLAGMAEASVLPLLISEFGVDAYRDPCGYSDASPCYNTFDAAPDGFGEDQRTQADWDTSLAKALVNHPLLRALSDPLLDCVVRSRVHAFPGTGTPRPAPRRARPRGVRSGVAGRAVEEHGRVSRLLGPHQMAAERLRPRAV